MPLFLFKFKNMNLGEQIELTLNSWAGIANKDEQSINLLHRTYRNLFNENVQTGCGNCNQKAFLRIRKYNYNILNNTTMAKNQYKDRKYLIKNNATLQIGFDGETYTNDSLTDEKAAELLKKHPNMKKHFSRVGEADGETARNATKVETDFPVVSTATDPADKEAAEKLLVDKTEVLPTTAPVEKDSKKADNKEAKK